MNFLPEFELNKPEEMQDFLDHHRIEIATLTLEAIKRAVSEDLLYIPIMKLKIQQIPVAVITVYRENFDESLQKCLLHFQDAEYYEQCAEIVKLLKDERLK